MKTGGSLCSAPVAPSGRSRRRRRKSSGGEKDYVVISFLSRVASVKTGDVLFIRKKKIARPFLKKHIR